MASQNLLLDVCIWLRHEDNQNRWLLVNVLICGGCQLEPERVEITLLILPMRRKHCLRSMLSVGCPSK